jgi:hypothetical protein
MEHVRQAAYEMVLRGCGFASLGILCVMTGLFFNPKLAFQAGGFLTTLMAFILILKANEALTGDCRKTEMWLAIDRKFRPPGTDAQSAGATMLRDAYLDFAMWTSLVSIMMWLLALAFSLAGAASMLGREESTPPEPVVAAQPHSVNVARTMGELRRTVPAIRYQGFP